MNKFFNKDNFICSTFDTKQKKQSLFVTICLVVFFIFSAFTFFNALYCFADAIGSIVCSSFDVAIKDLIRSLPIILSSFMSIWTVLLLQASFRNKSDEKRLKSYKKNAIALIAFAAFNVVYIIVLRIMGKYLSLVEGSPSPLYPLDAMLYSLLFAAIGVFTLVYLSKLEKDHPYVVPTRGPVVSKLRGLYCFGVSIWMLVAVYTFAAFFIGLFIIDFLHGYQFYSICLLLSFAIPWIYLCVWEFYYNNLTEDKKKEFLLPLAIVGLGVSALTTILYFVSLGLNLDAPSNIGFGILPVAFAANVNIATMICVFTPLIVSIVALIKGFLVKKSKKEE